MTGAKRSRLGAVLALLSSDKIGEVAAAAAAATRMQRASGLSWHQILQPPAALPTRGTDVEHDLDLILDNLDELGSWEAGFAKSVAAQSTWSDKQIAIIQRIAVRVRRMARTAA